MGRNSSLSRQKKGGQLFVTGCLDVGVYNWWSAVRKAPDTLHGSESIFPLHFNLPYFIEGSQKTSLQASMQAAHLLVTSLGTL